jgi:hypothetical protein
MDRTARAILASHDENVAIGSTFECVHPGTDAHAIPLDAKHSGSSAMDQDLAQVSDAYHASPNNPRIAQRA